MLVRSRLIRLSCLSLLIAMCVTLAVGCGQGGETSKAEYESQMSDVVADLGKASVAVANMKPDAPAAQRAKIIRNQGVLLEKAADRADDVVPPSDAETAHDEFVTALHKYAKLLGRLADASASQASSQKQSAILGEVGPLVDQMTKASNELAKKGYKFPPRGK